MTGTFRVAEGVSRSKETGPAGGGGRSSAVLTTATLLKTVIGAGIFSLPVGLLIATPLPGLAFLGMIGLTSGMSFWMIGYCCLVWNVSSFRSVWNRALGKRTAWIIDVTLLGNGWFTMVGYLVLIGDFTTKSLAGLLGETHFLAVNRILDQWFISAFVLLPLSLSRDLRRLAFTSVLGLCFTVYVLVLVLRDSWLHSAAWDDEIPLLEWRMGAFKAIALYTHAYVAHSSAPKIFSELERPTVLRWSVVVGSSYALTFFVYAAFAVAGLRRFGGEVEGNVLRNYESQLGVLIAWLGMGLSITFTYPIVFNSTREATMNLMAPSQKAKKHVIITVTFVVLTNLAASLCRDVALVNALAGSLLGCLVAFVFPALLFMKTLQAQLGASKRTDGLDEPLLPGQQPSQFVLQASRTPRWMLLLGLRVARVVILGGGFFAVLGFCVALQAE